MSQNRYYSSTAQKTTVPLQILAGDTSFVVAALTGYPVSTPWTGILDRDLATEEVVTVTGVAGTTLTVVRAQDGTSAVGHGPNATFEHGVSARDFNEPQVHLAATAAVHGISGNFVGDTDTQTLTNKTLTQPVIAQIKNSGTLTLPTTTDTLVGRATTDTLTNKTLSSPVVNTPTLNGSGGLLTLPAGPDTMVGRATTDTLTNKTLNGATLDAASTLGGVSGTTLAAKETAWTSYVPTWTAATTNPTLSDGSIAARYKQIGKLVFVEFYLKFGTSTNAGSGNWAFTLPVTADSTNLLGALSGHTSGLILALDSSVPQGYQAQIITGGSVFHIAGADSTGWWNATAPFTWANNDTIRGSFFYEAA